MLFGFTTGLLFGIFIFWINHNRELIFDHIIKSLYFYSYKYNFKSLTELLSEIRTVDINEEFIIACSIGNLKLAKMFMSTGKINKVYNKGEAFKVAIKNNHLDVAEWLLSLEKDNYVEKLVLSISPGLTIYEIAFGFVLFEEGNIEIAKWLLSLNKGINIHIKKESFFTSACYNGDIKAIKWLLSLDGNIDIHILNNYAFRLACGNGKLEVVKYLLSLDNKPIENKIINDALLSACKNGYLDVAKFLINLDKPDIHINYDKIIEYACENKKNSIIEWLILDDKIDIHKNNEYILRNIEDIKMLKWLVENYNCDIHINNDEIFRLACANRNLNLAKWIYNLDNNKPDIYFNDNECLIYVLNDNYDYTEMFNWIFKLYNKDVLHMHNDIIIVSLCMANKTIILEYILEYEFNSDIINKCFKIICHNSNIIIAKKIYEKYNITDDIINDIYLSSYHVSYDVVYYFSQEMRNWLLSLNKLNIKFINKIFIKLIEKDNINELNNFIIKYKPNIRYNNDEGYIYACENNMWEIADLLTCFCDDYELERTMGNVNFGEYAWKIKNGIHELLENKEYDKIVERLNIKIDNDIIDISNNCSICFTEYNFISSCKHYFCIECFMIWYINNNKKECCYCKQEIDIEKCCMIKI